MNSHSHGKASDVIFQGQDQPVARPLASPEYRQQALRFIVGLNRSKGLGSLSFSELALQMRDQSLRADIDPEFEPLSLESINTAVADLVRSRELVVDNRTVLFSEPPAAP